MKNTKFKVYDYDSKTMYNQEDLIITFDSIGEDVYVYKDGKVEPLYRYELLQYIGSNDTFDNEIYEGDILVISGYSYEEPEFECYGEVKYVNCGYCIEDEGEFVNISDFRGSYTTIFKVVGNVYENPELLDE